MKPTYYMKTITLDIADPVYEDFESYARRVNRKATDLISEAMEYYHRRMIQPKQIGAVSGELSIPLFPTRADAPATRMTVEELMTLQQDCLTKEDIARGGLPV
jgi:hypothetical protein